MSDDDYAAMLHLARDMTWVEAARFIRGEMGCTLMEGRGYAFREGANAPDTPLGRSVARYQSAA